MSCSQSWLDGLLDHWKLVMHILISHTGLFHTRSVARRSCCDGAMPVFRISYLELVPVCTLLVLCNFRFHCFCFLADHLIIHYHAGTPEISGTISTCVPGTSCRYQKYELTLVSISGKNTTGSLHILPVVLILFPPPPPPPQWRGY
jgi:hypothetical protein